MEAKLIVANWKMNGDLKMAHDYGWDLQRLLAEKPTSHKLVICPPNPYLAFMHGRFAGTDIVLGGQDCSGYPDGARTGEVSAAMLKDVGCRYVIIGHSERRQYHGETQGHLQDKLRQAWSAGLQPLFCIGESKEEHHHQQTAEVLKQQLEFLKDLNSFPLILAYEPLWAIGTGATPRFQEIEETCGLIKRHVHKAYKADVPVLYGGSVTADNAGEILGLETVDGVLVGGSSLSAQTFHKIATALIG